jgi:hypothetical protein
MSKKLLFSTAYLPPVSYFCPINEDVEIFVEREENFLKQTYRNRAYILSAHGIQSLTIPVYEGSLHKVKIRDIRIDYSKRWQQVHLRAMIASYNSSPYFEFYFEQVEKIISANHIFLIDLNTGLTELFLNILGINNKICFTTYFRNPNETENDFRYSISPKKPSPFHIKKYQQVFVCEAKDLAFLSIADLIFNTGPEAGKYLK